MQYVLSALFCLIFAVPVFAQGRGMAMPVIVQKEVKDPSVTALSNVAIEQVEIIGSYRRIYDFDYDQLCTFYNHSANIQSGGGLSCRFYDELPPKVQKRYDLVCQQLSARKAECPKMALPMQGGNVPEPAQMTPQPVDEGDQEPEAQPSQLPPKFEMLKRGKTYSVDELRGAKP